MTRKNARPGICTQCGHEVPAGAGELWWQPGPDDGGDVVGRTPAGWRVTHLDRALCERNRAADRAAERERRAEAAQQAAERAALEERALDAQRNLVERLLSQIPDCICAGYDWSPAVLEQAETPVSTLSLGVPANPALAGLSLGFSDWYERRAKTGERCFVHRFGNAAVLHGPREVVERAWRELRAENPDIFTPEACAAWLAEYGPDAKSPWGPCAGWQARAFLAGRTDLLSSEVAS